MTLRRNAFALLLGVAAPTAAMAQQDPTERLAEVLPSEVATRVVEIVADARARELPDQALARLALEGVTKGRSGEEVLAAVEAMLGDLGRADAALRAGGRVPEAGDVEAAATALRMGVDAGAVSELARSGASGESLAVPMMVLGTLTERGLPSDQAIAQATARMGGRAANGRPGPPAGIPGGAGGPPAGVGPDFAPGLGGGQVPVPGVNIPVGPPDGRGPPPDRPGQGRPGGS